MKKFTKICLVVAAVCAVAGMGCLIAGLVLGGTWGQFEEAFDNGDFSIGGIDLDVRDAYVVKESVSATEVREIENLGEINRIEVDMKSGGFYMEPSEDGDIRVEIEPDDKKFTTVRQSGKELIIENSYRNHSGSVIVYCPENMELKELEIDIDGGEAVLSVPLQVEAASVEIGAGSLVCSELLQAKESDWTVGAGEIVLDALAGPSIEMECEMGSICAVIRGKEEYYGYELECGMGEIRIGGSEYGGIGQEASRRGTRSDNGKSYMIEADCGMGTIEIDFDES